MIKWETLTKTEQAYIANIPIHLMCSVCKSVSDGKLCGKDDKCNLFWNDTLSKRETTLGELMKYLLSDVDKGE